MQQQKNVNLEYARICSLHFSNGIYSLKSKILKVPLNKRQLQKIAVPTLLLPVQQQISDKSARAMRKARKEEVERALNEAQSNLHCTNKLLHIPAQPVMFSPLVVKNKCGAVVTEINQFPNEENCRTVQSIFTGFSVEVYEADAIKTIFELGYGQLRLRNLPKSDKQKHNKVVLRHENCGPLILDLEESFFLVHTLKYLAIKNLGGCCPNSQELFQLFSDIKPNFIYTFIAYQYLRSKSWIVKSGTKFGGDFLIYKWGPQYHHSTFVVLVLLPKQKSANLLQGFQRVAETSGKEVLFLEVHPPQNKQHTTENYLEHIEYFTVTETIPKRFNLKRNK